MGAWAFRLRASSFCSGAKGTKRPPGAAHGHFQCPIPPPPDPLFFLRGGATKGRSCIHPAQAKDRIPLLAPPAAAPCCLNRDLLLQVPSRLAFLHRGALRWSLRLRGGCSGQGSGCSTLYLLTCSSPLDLLTSAPIPALDLPDYRLLGGTSNRGPTPPVRGRCRAK